MSNAMCYFCNSLNIPPIANGTESVEEFMMTIESLAEKNVRLLPRNFSREDVYKRSA